MKNRDRRDEQATGVGPGVTGASGDLIEGTGGAQGVGGTGEASMQDAAGQRADERQNPAPQELQNASPDGGTDRPARLPGSATGTVGGGGGETVSSGSGPAGLPGGDGMADVPGGTRNVGPANDQDVSGDRAHTGTDRAEPEDQDRKGPREGGRDR